MEKFNFNQIMARYNPDLDKLAPLLYPDVKHPRLSLDRVVKGESVLNINQVITLAHFLAVSVDELLHLPYKMKSSNGELRITKGEYSAVVKMDSNTMGVFRNGNLIGEYAIASKVVALAEIFERIEKIIAENEAPNYG